MLTDRNNHLIQSTSDPEYIKLIVVSIFTLIFGVAVIYVVLMKPELKDSVHTLTTFLGLGIGYVLGTKITAQT